MDLSFAFSGRGGGSSSGTRRVTSLSPSPTMPYGMACCREGPGFGGGGCWGPGLLFLLLSAGGLVGGPAIRGVLDVLHQLFPLPFRHPWPPPGSP